MILITKTSDQTRHVCMYACMYILGATQGNLPGFPSQWRGWEIARPQWPENPQIYYSPILVINGGISKQCKRVE